MQAQLHWKKEVDSLSTLLRKEKNDSIKMTLLFYIGEHYEYNNPTVGKSYFSKSYELAKKTKCDWWQLRNLASFMVTSKTATEAKYYGELGIALAKKIKNKHAEAAFYNNLAEIYDNLDNMEKALEYYQNSRVIFEHLPQRIDTLNLISVYGNILGVYSKYEQPKKALELGLKGLALAKKTKDDDALMSIYPNLTEILIQLKRQHQALSLINEQLKIGFKTNNKNEIVDALQQKIEVYRELYPQKNFQEFAQQMKSISLESDYGQGLAYANYYLALHFLQNKENEKSLEYANLAFDAVKKYELNVPLEEVYELLSDIAIEKGNITEYQKYKKKIKEIRNKNNLDKILKYNQELQAQYSLNEKQNNINALNADKKAKIATLKRQKEIMFLLSIVLIISLFFIYYYFKNGRQKNKLLLATEQLQKQKISELEKQNQLTAAALLIKGQEKERERVARDLHDGLGGILSGVKFSLQNINNNYLVSNENEKLFTKALEQLDSGINEMRRVAHNMMPESLIKFGLQSAIADYCEGIKQTKQLLIQFDCFGFDERIEQSTEVIIYRIIQELINNTLKHSKAEQVIVQLVKNENMILITVEDNGIGFDSKEVQNSKNSGMANVLSRVNYLNGSLQVKSEEGKGTNITIEFKV
jgi:signal transduction histidine kinase